MMQQPAGDLVPTTSLAAEVAAYGPTRRVHVLVASWLAEYDSPNTRDAYARDMKMWLKFCDEHQIDPLNTHRAAVALWKQQGAGYANPHGPSVARRLSAVASWYEYLVQEEVIERSPAVHVKRPKVDADHSTTYGLDEAEVRAMIEAAGEISVRVVAVVVVLVLTGLRVAELVWADVEDLGWDRKLRTVDVTRKGGARQRIPLTEPAWVALHEFIGDRTSGPLITTKTGARISPFQVRRIVKRVARMAGLPAWEQVTPHALRHAFVTLSLDAGAMIEDVQDAVGHRDIKTTIRYRRNRRKLENNPTHKLTEFLIGKDEEDDL